MRKYLMLICSVTSIVGLLWARPTHSPKANKSRIGRQGGNPVRKELKPRSPRIEFKSQSGFIVNDPLRLVDVSDVQGRLTYCFYQINQSGVGTKTASYLVLVDINKSSKKDDLSLQTLSFSTEKSAEGKIIFDSSFSPDGRYILFKYGLAWDNHGKYQLYILDTATKKINLVSRRDLTFRKVSWSPDGNYIAYVEGGDSEGNISDYVANEEYYIGPLKLYVCNWRTGQEILVSTNDTIKDSFGWRFPHNLIYGARSAQGTPTEAAGTDKATASDSYPNIYEYSVENRKRRVLLKFGYRPLPSPDGQRIIFFGPEKVENSQVFRSDWLNRPGSIPFSVVNSDGTGRKVIDTKANEYPVFLWQPDNFRFIELRELVKSRNEPSKQSHAQLIEWDSRSQKKKLIGAFSAKNFKPLDATGIFRLKSISPDSSTVLANVYEITGEQSAFPYLIGINRMQSLNLQNGAVNTIATFLGNVDWDWHFGAVSTK